MKKNTKNYLIKKLKEFYNKKGRVPICSDASRKNNMPDRSVFEMKFGSWNNALIAADLNINKTYRKWNKEGIIYWLRKKYDELGQTPGIGDFDKDSEAPGKNTVRKLFGNWTNALREAKLPVKRFNSKKELINLLKRLYKQLNKTPTRTDINNAKGFPSYTPFVNKFGSYTSACLSAGLIPNDGRNNNIWKSWERHCFDMAKVMYKDIEIKKESIVEGVPDIFVKNKNILIDAKTCGYKDFKEQIKKYCKGDYKLEFWCIFRGIENKSKKITYVYAEDLAKKMKKLGRNDLAIRCHQFLRNVFDESQTVLDIEGSKNI